LETHRGRAARQAWQFPRRCGHGPVDGRDAGTLGLKQSPEGLSLGGVSLVVDNQGDCGGFHSIFFHCISFLLLAAGHLLSFGGRHHEQTLHLVSRSFRLLPQARLRLLHQDGLGRKLQEDIRNLFLEPQQEEVGLVQPGVRRHLERLHQLKVIRFE
jgi:hypothetical protein